jgi:hypothetical protein
MARRDRYDDLTDWIKSAQDVLGLTEWSVTVLRDASDSDAWADIEPHDQAYTATLRVSNDFWRQPAAKQLDVLTHELTHLLLARADQTVYALEQSLGKIAWAIFEPQFDNQNEAATDRVSLLLRQLLKEPTLPRA